MQRFLCRVLPVLTTFGSVVAFDSESSSRAPSHPVVNIHLTDSNDAAVLSGLADRQKNLEDLLGALETRAQSAEDALGNQMSLVNAQMHELVSIGSSLAASVPQGGMMLQLRGGGRAQRVSVQDLREQLALVTQDVHSSDKDSQPGADSAGDGFDPSGPEAVARQKLMSAQKNFASVENIAESDNQKSIEAKLALAMESPSHVGSPVPLLSPADVVVVCQPDAHACPQGWRDDAGVCVASSEYVGPCAGELTLSGMSREQLLAIAKYCRLELPCQ